MRWILLRWAALGLCFATFVHTIAAASSRPLVLLPGFGASVLESQYNLTETPHIWCSKSSHGQWERLWGPPAADLVPHVVECWWHKFRIHYTTHNHTTTAHDAPGVQLRVHPGASGLEVEPHEPSTNVYRQFLERFPQTTVLTYDFRFTPAGRALLLTQWQRTIESIYMAHGPVTIVSHSYGALWMHYFLTRHVNATWKDRHLHAWIPLSPAYGGAVSALQSIVSGDTDSPLWRRDVTLKYAMRSLESILWLLPLPALWGDQVLVQQAARNYTAQDYPQLLQDAGFAQFDILWKRVNRLTALDKDQRLADPNVNVYPIYGDGLTTASGLVYAESLDQNPWVRTTTAGDGTLTLQSLQAGNHWSATPLVLANTSHTEICSDAQTLAYVAEIIDLEGGISIM